MNTLQCKTCNTPIPSDARFCGRCGKPTNVDQVETKQLVTGQVSATFFTNSDLSARQDDWNWRRIEEVSTVPFPPKIALFPLVGGSINPSPAHVSMVQGSPQMGGVPSLQGFPQGPGSAMTHAPLQQPPAGAGGSPALPNAPSSSAHMQPFPLTSSHHQHQMGQHQHDIDVDQHHPSHHLHHAGHLHDPGVFHLSSQKHYKRYSRMQSKRVQHMGRWHLKSLVMSALCVCVLGGFAALFLLPLVHGHAQPPATLILNGHAQPPATLILNGSVVPGGNVFIQGRNFTPGGTISFTIDGHLASRADGSSTAQLQRLSRDSSLAEVSQLAQDTTKAQAGGMPIIVKSDGSFETTIQVDPRWRVGSSHLLIATEQSDGQKASLTLVIPHPANLVSCSSRTDMTSIVLGAVPEGQTQPASTTMALCTTGSGLVQWTANWNRQQVKWLQIAQSGSIQAPLSKQLTISASAIGLKAGSYNAIVTFTDQHNSTPVTLKVTFIVRSAQDTSCLNISTQSLTYNTTHGQSGPAAQMVKLTNCGSPGTWSATTHTDDGANWLQINPISGQLNSKASLAIPVSVASSTLAQGIYTGQVTFKTGSGIAVVNVMLDVQPSPKNPLCISVAPQSLTLNAAQGNAASQVVSVGNCGPAGSWSSTFATNDGANWLSVSPGSGNLASNASQNVSITASGVQLLAGTYSGKVTFTMGASSQTVSVFFTVLQQQQKPCLSVNQTSLPFKAAQGQSDPAPQTVTLTNCGPTASWSATTAKGSSWLTLSQNSNTLSAGAQQNVTVRVSIAGLSAGTYTDTITFTMQSGSATTTQTVSVSLMVQPSPPPQRCIQTSPGSLLFKGGQGGSNPAPQTVTVTNCGPAGSWSESTDKSSSWLAISPTSNTLNAGAQQNVTVSASTTGLNAGTYTDTITFTITTSTGTAQATVAVSLTVQPQSACIKVNPGTLTFTGTQGGSNPSPQTTFVSNCGPDSTWSASTVHGSSWLSFNPPSGTFPAGAAEYIYITPSIAGLSFGTYSDTITFTITTSSGSQQQQTLLVTLYVQPPPCLQITSTTPTAHSDGIVYDLYNDQTKTAPPVTVVVSNCGSAAGTLSAGADVSWLPYDLQPNTNLNAGGALTITISPTSPQLNAVGTVTITLTTNGVATQVTVRIAVYSNLE